MASKASKEKRNAQKRKLLQAIDPPPKSTKPTGESLPSAASGSEKKETDYSIEVKSFVETLAETLGLDLVSKSRSKDAPSLGKQWLERNFDVSAARAAIQKEGDVEKYKTTIFKGALLSGVQQAMDIVRAMDDAPIRFLGLYDLMTTPNIAMRFRVVIIRCMQEIQHSSTSRGTRNYPDFVQLEAAATFCEELGNLRPYYVYHRLGEDERIAQAVDLHNTDPGTWLEHFDDPENQFSSPTIEWLFPDQTDVVPV